MSNFKQGKKADGSVENIVSQFSTVVTGGSNGFINEEGGRAAISMEAVSNADEIFADAETELTSALENAGIESTQINAVSMEAAAITALALGNPAGYREAAQGGPAGGHGIVVDAGEGVPSMEAYDNTAIGNFAAHSLVFNYLASQQDPLGEALYRTVVLTPEQGGLDISIDQTVIQKEIQRAINGQASSFERKNLIEAFGDASILRNEATVMVPVKSEDGKNDASFVDETLVGAKNLLHDGVETRTAPLKPGRIGDFIGLCGQATNLSGQQLDGTDAIDPNLGLAYIYISVKDVTADKTSILKIPTSGLPRAMFKEALEGGSRDATLAFVSNTIRLSKAYEDITGTAAEALDSLGAKVVDLTVGVSGNVNLETGALNVFGDAPAVLKMYEGGDELAIVDAELAIVDNLELSFIGYDLDAKFSNANLRHRGLVVECEKYIERYGVPYTAPISAIRPSAESDKRRGTDLKSMIAAQRTRNANNAVTKLIARASTLSQYASADLAGLPTPEIEGAGRLLVKPYYRYLELDLSAEVNSTKTHEKAADVSDAIVNAIRALAYPMAADSNYATALDQVFPGEKPNLVLATGTVLEQHIMISGDGRTASIGMDYQVVSTPDSRMVDSIFGTFARKQRNGEADALSFGAHAWMPELVSSGRVSKGGSTSDVTTIQARSRHVDVLPVMFEIKVTNLDKVLTTKVS